VYKPVAIANYFIDLREGQGLTLMQLLKLSYIAHGFNLAIFDRPLANEYVQAWKFGPVFPSIYHEFKYEIPGEPITNCAKRINESTGTLEKITENFQPTEKSLIEIVYKIYGKIDGWKLSALTHKEGTPWYKVWYEGEGSKYHGVPIENNKIKDHFKGIVGKYVRI